MNRNDQHWHESRRIAEWIIVEGDLVLQTPAHFGSGNQDRENVADLSLLRDPSEPGTALLPGASIAGALRNYWRERVGGYRAETRHSDLFGSMRGVDKDDEGSQSLLIVEDAHSEGLHIELRDGVKIDGASRTAEAQKLFDMELLQAGTRFPLRFELLIAHQKPVDMDKEKYDELDEDKQLEKMRASLLESLALALAGFQNGEIRLGARKRRGFGRCQVEAWQVRRYDMAKPGHLLAWLAGDREDVSWTDDTVEVDITKLFDGLSTEIDERRYFDFTADFTVQGSLMVQAGGGRADVGADMVHLRRPAIDETVDPVPVLPGTSLAGVLRARAERIVKTLAPAKSRALIEDLFGIGPDDNKDGAQAKKKHLASKLVVDEAEIEGSHSLVQHRIRIDRFTGGAMDNYLFNEAPIFGGKLTLHWRLRNPTDYEVGLLLLALKDLWTGDLAVGGEQSVGRGRLQGQSATLVEQNGTDQTWTIRQTGEILTVEGAPQDELEKYVEKLHEYLKKEAGDDQNT